jgi:alkaline phosphatase
MMSLLAVALWLTFVLFVSSGETLSVFVRAAPMTSAEAPAAFPHNVIILVGDGMGYYHVDAANLYQHGATGQQGYEQFPYQYGMSTYAVDGSYDPQQAWDSFTYVQSGYLLNNSRQPPLPQARPSAILQV